MVVQTEPAAPVTAEPDVRATKVGEPNLEERILSVSSASRR